MKIDAKLIATLLAMEDDELWATVCTAAETKNIHLKKETPPKETMDRLRAAFSNADKIDFGSAIRLLAGLRDRDKK